MKKVMKMKKPFEYNHTEITCCECNDKFICATSMRCAPCQIKIIDELDNKFNVKREKKILWPSWKEYIIWLLMMGPFIFFVGYELGHKIQWLVIGSFMFGMIAGPLSDWIYSVTFGYKDR